MHLYYCDTTLRKRKTWRLLKYPCLLDAKSSIATFLSLLHSFTSLMGFLILLIPHHLGSCVTYLVWNWCFRFVSSARKFNVWSYRPHLVTELALQLRYYRVSLFDHTDYSLDHEYVPTMLIYLVYMGWTLLICISFISLLLRQNTCCWHVLNVSWQNQQKRKTLMNSH